MNCLHKSFKKTGLKDAIILKISNPNGKDKTWEDHKKILMPFALLLKEIKYEKIVPSFYLNFKKSW